MERERAEHRADHERLEAARRRAIAGDRRGDRRPVAGGAGQRGAGAAQVVGSLGPDADQQHLPEVGVLRTAERDRHRGDLAGLAGGPVELEHAEQVEAELLGELGAAGTEDDRVVRRTPRAAPGRPRPRRRGRRAERVAERELRR